MGVLILAWVLLAAPEGAVQPPELRLPGNARPVRQAVELTVDPGLESFTGTAVIELEVREPLDLLWLNATSLKITSASLGPAGAMSPARVVEGGDDFVGFSTGTRLPPGPARLQVAFEGAVSRRDNEGVFAVQEGDAWYLFTQFQALAARRAFPCFDEPSYKIPWQITLRVPHGLVALSNSAAAATRAEDGRDVVRFQETPQLPSYLVAFAVGPFELVDVGPAGRGRIPTRLAVPRGRAGDTAWARASTPPLLELLEDYFDRPYPYAKLDQVAIPGAAFAMEHPGLVTYGQTMMVQKASEETITSRQLWVSIAAHELAHQWFGNLVTLEWWDDTWLNESFASWLGEKVSDRFRPEWRLATERVSQRSQALVADGLATARRIRQPIATKNDVANAFDFVTYAKGQAVLEMLEAWLGEDAFRRGIRAYIGRHAGGNATAADFVAALSEAAGRDVGGVLSSFLDQTGAPVVTAALRCDGTPRLAVSQRPYRALGSPTEAKSWNVPVCARVSGGTPACSVLATAAADVPVASSACPGWSFANAAGAGYYRSVVSGPQARRAVEGGLLTPQERVALAGDVAALVASGDVAAADAMELAPILARDADRVVVRESARLLRDLERLVPDSGIESFRKIVRNAYGQRARALGWSGVPGEDDDARLLRRSVVGAAADLGRDAELGREAVARVGRWLDGDSAALDPDLVSEAITAAIGTGDRDVFARVLREVVATTDRARRERLVSGLRGARDPELARQVLALTLDARVDPRDSVWVLWQLGGEREGCRLAFDFLTANYDALVARLPQGEMSPVPFLPWVGSRLCSADTRAELEGFFGKRSASVVGAPRVLAQVLESVDQCVARRQAQQAGLAAFLSARP